MKVYKREGADYRQPLLFFLKVSVFRGHQELSSLLVFQRKHESFILNSQFRVDNYQARSLK